MTKYNWGIIGNGWIAHDMADALNAVNGEIYAVSGVNENALREFAKEKHVQHVYTDPDKMIADPNIDIVYIATPHTFHYEYIKKVLNAGKHVFCEKAITVNARQFDEVDKLAKEKGYTYVIDANSVIYAVDGKDITEDVLKAVGGKLPEAPKAEEKKAQ